MTLSTGYLPPASCKASLQRSRIPPCWPESRPSCWSMSENNGAAEPVDDGASSGSSYRC